MCPCCSQKQVGQAGSEVGVSPLPGRVGEPKASTPPLTAPPPLPATPTIPDTPCIADMKPPLGSVSADIKETSSSKEDKVQSTSLEY
ncbi:hypothetical protein DPMN_149462 [Dreissena polymorpha]|uniref:Uncharacterized protein n=1 Tax=Dreissena polymorpha TaxID=45954 RepID=A0A9D4FG08_DREPO|nr:hypothetical protein DPMN_149462 [Dreissena polymorpha]